MDRYNLFELVVINFDPVNTTVTAIQKAIESKKNQLDQELQQDSPKRDQYIRERAFLADCLGESDKSLSIFEFNDKGKATKVNARYLQMAEDHKQKEIAKLTARVALFAKGDDVFTQEAIKFQRRQTRLSEDTIRKIYEEAGFTIVEVNPLAAYPKFPQHAQRIYDELAVLRRASNPDPRGHDLSMCVDLYAFTAFICSLPGKSPEIPSEYKLKSTLELKSVLDGHALQLSTRNDPFGKQLASIVAAARNYVFDDDAHRKAYDLFLVYRSAEVQQLLQTIKQVSDLEKRNPVFADENINRIQSIFGDRAMALAIFNYEAGIQHDPYIPDKVYFDVRCSHCGSISRFKNVEEAKTIGKCKRCQAALYKICNRCRDKVLTYLDQCPSCGFQFASAALFAKHYAAAEQALASSDFDRASKHLFDAQSADPSETKRVEQLRSRIDAARAKFAQPINVLNELTAAKKFETASRTLVETIKSYPELNVSGFKAEINAALARAHASFESSKGLSSSRRADACLHILSQCVDYKLALDFLEANPPLPCDGFTVNPDNANGSAILKWSPSTEQGVTYRIVRKVGAEVPVSKLDGEIVCGNTTETTFRDTGIQPGKSYSYAVFAIRSNVFSPAVGKSVISLAEVTSARFEQSHRTIRLTWNKPMNSTGVTIKRTLNGVSTILSRHAVGSYEDKDVNYGDTYIYCLSANYNGLPSSQGVELVVTPLVMIDSFSILAEQVRGNIYKVGWDIKHHGIDLRVLIDGRVIRESKSEARSCELALPVNGLHTITAEAFSGGEWLQSSNSQQVNTYSGLCIDRAYSGFAAETPIVGGTKTSFRVELHIKVSGSIPPSVVGFYYAVRRKTEASPNAPWADGKEIGSSTDIYRVSLDTFMSNREIIHTDTAQDEASYYVSLFTIYRANGGEVVSSVSKCRFDRPLNATVFWKVSKGLLGPAKLTFEITANRSFERIPALTLCVSRNGQHLLSASDASAQCILELPEVYATTPSRSHRSEYTILNGDSLKRSKLFLFEESAVPNESFSLRWAHGFSGKV